MNLEAASLTAYYCCVLPLLASALTTRERQPEGQWMIWSDRSHAERKQAHQARAATYAWVPQITLTGPIGLYPGGVMKVAPLAIENPAGPFGPVMNLALP
jgi:hypothetical protein